MARPKIEAARVAAKLDEADAAALEELKAAPWNADGGASTVIRASLRTLVMLREPLDTSDAHHLAELAGRFGVTPAMVVSALLHDANARATVKRNLSEMAGS